MCSSTTQIFLLPNKYIYIFLKFLLIIAGVVVQKVGVVPASRPWEEYYVGAPLYTEEGVPGMPPVGGH